MNVIKVVSTLETHFLVLNMDSTETSVDKLQRDLSCIRKNISKLVTETKSVEELTFVVFDEKT